jgi:hypothetical protein
VGLHSLTLSNIPRSMRCDSQTSLLARAFASPCLGREPKAKVATKILIMCKKQCMKVGTETTSAIGCVFKCNTIPIIGLFDEFFYFCSILFIVLIIVISYASDELATMLEVGDNFIVNAKERNDENASFC